MRKKGLEYLSVVFITAGAAVGFLPGSWVLPLILIFLREAPSTVEHFSSGKTLFGIPYPQMPGAWMGDSQVILGLVGFAFIMGGVAFGVHLGWRLWKYLVVEKWQVMTEAQVRLLELRSEDYLEDKYKKELEELMRQEQSGHIAERNADEAKPAIQPSALARLKDKCIVLVFRAVGVVLGTWAGSWVMPFLVATWRQRDLTVDYFGSKGISLWMLHFADIPTGVWMGDSKASLTAWTLLFIVLGACVGIFLANRCWKLIETKRRQRALERLYDLKAARSLSKKEQKELAELQHREENRPLA